MSATLLESGSARSDSSINCLKSVLDQEEDRQLKIANMERMLDRADRIDMSVSSKSKTHSNSRKSCKACLNCSWHLLVALLLIFQTCVLSAGLYAVVKVEPQVSSMMVQAESALHLVDENLPMINTTLTELAQIDWKQLASLANRISTAIENGCKKYPWVCSADAQCTVSLINSTAQVFCNSSSSTNNE